jgi:hypothetical protein
MGVVRAVGVTRATDTLILGRALETLGAVVGFDALLALQVVVANGSRRIAARVGPWIAVGALALVRSGGDTGKVALIFAACFRVDDARVIASNAEVCPEIAERECPLVALSVVGAGPALVLIEAVVEREAFFACNAPAVVRRIASGAAQEP